MENKKMLLLMAGLLVVLLGGASVLYSRLGGTVNREMLQTQAVVENSGNASQTDNTGNEDDGRTEGIESGSKEDNGQSRAEIGSGETVSVERDSAGKSSAGQPGDDSSRKEGEAETSGTGQAPSAPDFTVQDGDGNPVKLSELVGKPVVLNFWASWCPPCKGEMPDFQEAFSEYGDTIHFMMVNLTDGNRETVETAKNYVEEKGYTFPVYYDTESEAAMVYGVMAVPATYFIDADGKPVAWASGAIDKETLEKGIRMVLPENG